MKISPGASGVLTRRLILLAPPQASVTGFTSVIANPRKHEALLDQAQRFRARIYVETGAVEAGRLTVDGRHVQPADKPGWHLLSVDSSGGVRACARYVLHDGGLRYEHLGVARSALAQSEVWGQRLRKAIESEITFAKQRQFGFVEVGGWAIDSPLRASTEAIRMMLAFYALSDWFGGVIGITTAKTTCSAPVLRKIGGRPLNANGADLPPYYDPEYKCDLEVLRFDSSRPHPKFVEYLRNFQSDLLTIPVVAHSVRHTPETSEGLVRNAPQAIELYHGSN